MEVEPSKAEAPAATHDHASARSRPRASQACDACSKKKSKCDGEKPRCGGCVRNGVECTYTRKAKKRGPPPGYFSSIMARLRQLESKIADSEAGGPDAAAALQAAVDSASHAAHTALAQSAAMNRAPASYHSPPGGDLPLHALNAHPAHGGHPPMPADAEALLAHFESQFAGLSPKSLAPSPEASSGSSASGSTNGATAAGALHPGGSPPTAAQPAPQINFAAHPTLAASGPLALPMPGLAATPAQPFGLQPATAQRGPDIALVMAYLEWFNTKIPLFNHHVFLRDVERMPPALLNAIYALACTAPRFDGSFTYNAGDSYYIAAKAAFDDSLEAPSVWTVATTVLLASYASGSGRGTAATVFVAAGLRIAQQLQMDREGDLFSRMSQPTEDQEFRRRVWFQLLETDFSTAFATSMPFLVTASSPEKVQTPSDKYNDPSNFLSNDGIDWMNQEEAEFHRRAQEHGLVKTAEMCESLNIWKQMIKLQKLARRVICFVRELCSEDRDMDEAEEDARRAELDAEMQKFYDELPPHMQVISTEYSSDPTSRLPPSWRTAYMQCLYFFIRMCVHSDVIPRMAEEAGQMPLLTTNPSLLKSREMARNVTQLVLVFLANNPYFHHVSPFIGRMIFHVALVQILLMRCVDADIKEQNLLVDAHIQALRNISTYFLPCVHELKIVEAFRTIPFKPIVSAKCPKI
ncbi:hypothetical protein HK105_209077 [Polyrhizophydium stewartii]|uniref:Zn(2)-C6 fungal-type domain-containing protein n=1 Tax=Polyrhizophydium stewartii TaxID=2732419 RepID=A0ABR4MW16_9FUNG